MESCSYCLLEIKSRQKCKNIGVFTFSLVESTIMMAIVLINGNIIPKTFEKRRLAVFLFVYTFPKSEKWASSSPWISSEWNAIWIVFGATISGFPSFRASDGQKADALWILWEENRRSIFSYFLLYTILWTIDFSWTQIFSIIVHLLICSRRLYFFFSQLLSTTFGPFLACKV